MTVIYPMKIFSLLVLLLSPMVCFAEIAVPLGSKSAVQLQLPEVFHFDQESDDTVFIMPRKNDLNGPVSLRFTTHSDLREH